MSKISKKKLLRRRRAALVALGFAGLALLATLVLLLFKAAQWANLFTPERPETFNLALSLAAGLTLIALSVYALLQPEEVRRFLTGRQALYGTNAGVMLIAFVGLLIAINLIVYKFPPDWLPRRWDLTEDRQHTLAPGTLATLQRLPQKVTALAFYTTRLSPAMAVELLTDFRDNSNGMFDFQVIDPEYNPVTASNAGVTRDGMIVLYMGERREEVASVSEQDLTAALVRLIDPQERVVYFLTGHGEGDPQKYEETSLSSAREALEFKNYTVATLNLATTPEVPANAQAVVIAGPRVPLTEAEVARLDAYLKKGGSLVVMLEPPALIGLAGQPDPLAEWLGSAWSIRLRDDLVIDPSNSPTSEAVAAEYYQHPITERLDQIVTVFPTARSLEVLESDTLTVTTLIRTGSSAWSETDFSQQTGDAPRYDQDADLGGPLVLAAAAEDKATGARVVVIGDSDFATDKHYRRYRNGALLINSIDWAAEQENLLGLNPATPTQRSLKYLSGFQLVTLLLGSICLLPLLVIGLGVSTWIARRRRG